MVSCSIQHHHQSHIYTVTCHRRQGTHRQRYPVHTFRQKCRSGDKRWFGGFPEPEVSKETCATSMSAGGCLHQNRCRAWWFTHADEGAGIGAGRGIWGTRAAASSTGVYCRGTNLRFGLASSSSSPKAAARALLRGAGAAPAGRPGGVACCGWAGLGALGDAAQDHKAISRESSRRGSKEVGLRYRTRHLARLQYNAGPG